MRIDSIINQKPLPTSLISRVKLSVASNNGHKNRENFRSKLIELTNVNIDIYIDQLHRQILELEQKELEIEKKAGFKIFCQRSTESS